MGLGHLDFFKLPLHIFNLKDSWWWIKNITYFILFLPGEKSRKAGNNMKMMREFFFKRCFLCASPLSLHLASPFIGKGEDSLYILSICSKPRLNIDN